MTKLETNAATENKIQNKKYGLKSKNIVHTLPTENAIKLPAVLINEVNAKALLHLLFVLVSSTMIWVIGFFPIMKNPIRPEKIEMIKRSLVQNIPTHKRETEPKQVSNMSLFW